MSTMELKDKVFQILDCSDLEDDKGSETDCDNNSENLINVAKYRYVQIKKCQIEASLRKSEVIQIIDISSQMMCEKANAERRLMS